MAPNSPLTPRIIGHRRDGRPIHLIAGAEDTPKPPEETPKPADAPPATPPADPPKRDADEPLRAPGKKALESEREARQAAEKAARDAQARIKEYEDKDKTEAQRLTDENTELKAAKAKSDREALVARVAMDHKLDKDDLDLLHGDTEEELTARAKRIAELKTAAGAGAGSADQGAKPPAKTDLPSQIKAAEAKGDFASAMRLKNQQAMAMITAT
jgi:hypothetical protein